MRDISPGRGCIGRNRWRRSAINLKVPLGSASTLDEGNRSRRSRDLENAFESLSLSDIGDLSGAPKPGAVSVQVRPSAPGSSMTFTSPSTVNRGVHRRVRPPIIGKVDVHPGWPRYSTCRSSRRIDSRVGAFHDKSDLAGAIRRSSQAPHRPRAPWNDQHSPGRRRRPDRNRLSWRRGGRSTLQAWVLHGSFR